MTTSAIAKLIDSYLTDLEGQSGFWRGTRNEIPVFVFSDESHDRMRIMSPVGVIEELEPELLSLLLQSNYDRALDARYAMRGNELWSVVVHPLATLSGDDLASYFDQVVALVKNTGTTYASSELVFRSFPADESEANGEGNGDGDASDRDDVDDEDDEEDTSGRP